MPSVGSLWKRGLELAAVVCGVGLTGLFVPQTQAGPITLLCGAVLGPGGTFTLNADVGPCDDDSGPAAIVVISATLDLKGHTVSCQDFDWDGVPDGIVLLGQGARVKNGTVAGCAEGVWVLGAGKNTVENIDAHSSTYDGIHVDSSRNTVKGNITHNNGEDGVHIDSDNNRVEHNSSYSNDDDGFDIDGGLGKNQLFSNWAGWNDDDGFDVDTDDNRLSDNTASWNRHGFDVDGGDLNVLQSNWATHNLEGIIVADTSKNQVLGNTVTDNTYDGINLRLGAYGTLVKSNAVHDNGADGIDLDWGATNNFVDHNTATGNGANDLEDNNPACDANTWKSNTFGSANQGCIQ